ncbi:MAG: hypothetical protein EHM42_02770 [Planctomycetaceae bacterium]|nr:MAG: hypothetical protein EHM42_02770 [Planctomycetaceae bacterium]
MNIDWLYHAFAVPRAAEFSPSESQRQLVERVCRTVVERDLQAPAAILLESVRPLHRVSAQFLHFLGPVLSLAGQAAAASELALFLEHPGAIEYLADRLEASVRSAKSDSASPVTDES